MTHGFEIMRAPVQTSPWWTCPRPSPSAPRRLWCLPSVGSGAVAWHPWAVKLGATAEVVAARLPARETRLGEAPLTRMTAVVDALVFDIVRCTDIEYVLCGHSLGGLIVFELARRLRELGAPPPRALIVCGTRAPHRPRLEPPVHHLPAAELITEIERRYGAMPPEIRDLPEFADLFLPPLRADMEVYETYRLVPAKKLDLPLLALGGTRDQVVSRDDVLAWSEHTTARCETAFFDAAHFFPREKVDEVVPVVSRFLASV